MRKITFRNSLQLNSQASDEKDRNASATTVGDEDAKEKILALETKGY